MDRELLTESGSMGMWCKMRIFHGVDLDKNYGSLMWNTGDPKTKRKYALLRQFRGHCLRLEREMKTGMFVMDRDNRIYQIIDIKGWGIEEKEYWLQRFTNYKIEKRTATEIYPLEWWMEERDKMGKNALSMERNGRLAEEAQSVSQGCPAWFQVVDAIMRREKGA